VGIAFSFEKGMLFFLHIRGFNRTDRWAGHPEEEEEQQHQVPNPRTSASEEV
jgi:hypothetical protein